MAHLCGALIRDGYRVLLVPHVFRPGRHDPRVCDYAVAQRVEAVADRPASLALVQGDLSPTELKSIIGCAHVHVGARYHSLVAALSAGVPAVALSWHPKYRDLMQTYGVGDSVFDGENGELADLLALVRATSRGATEIAAQLREAQAVASAQVRENAALVARWLTA
jgi:colanic acid/amylovoran biosynthesis protein